MKNFIERNKTRSLLKALFSNLEHGPVMTNCGSGLLYLFRSFSTLQTGNMVGTAAMVALEDIFYEEVIRRREVAMEGKPLWKPLDRRQFERRCCSHGEIFMCSVIAGWIRQAFIGFCFSIFR